MKDAFYATLTAGAKQCNSENGSPFQFPQKYEDTTVAVPQR